MKFVITWSVPADSYKAAIQKFLDTGAQPPAGVKMLGRYHGLQGSMRGFIIAESADAKGIYTWLADWMEVCGFEIIPVVEDGDAAAILQSVKR